MKSKRYSALDAAAKILDMDSESDIADVQNDELDDTWSEHDVEETHQNSKNVERYDVLS